MKNRLRAALLALPVALAATVAVLPTAGASAGPAGWTSVSVPATGNNVSLLGAFARTNSDAWAVGQQFVGAGQPQAPAAAYHWNGSTWALTPTPNLGEYGALRAVSASSAGDALAVGFTMIRRHDYGTLIEHWNGSAWSVSSVDAITGFSAGLSGVVDLSPTNAWAVGIGQTGGLLEQFNGTTWTPVTIPDEAFTPDAITAVSATDIWVIGNTINPATEASEPEALNYNGTTWKVVPVAQPNETSSTLNAITAISATSVWAVGEDTGAGSAPGGSTLIEHYNGSTWSIVPSPTPGAYPSLTGVAGRSASDVYAVGTNLPSVNGGPEHAMILRFNGSTWSTDSNGQFGGELAAAATFPGAGSEWAVGTSSSDGGLVLSHG